MLSRHEYRQLTGPQIRAALQGAGLPQAAKHGNVYNLVRAGNIDGVTGTYMSGATMAAHAATRSALRNELKIALEQKGGAS